MSMPKFITLSPFAEYNDIQIKELAQEIGVSKNTIANYLTTSNTLPNIETAVKIAQALNTSVEYLVVGEDFSDNPKKQIINEINHQLNRLELSELQTAKTIISALVKK